MKAWSKPIKAYALIKNTTKLEELNDLRSSKKVNSLTDTKQYVWKVRHYFSLESMKELQAILKYVNKPLDSHLYTDDLVKYIQEVYLKNTKHLIHKRVPNEPWMRGDRTFNFPIAVYFTEEAKEITKLTPKEIEMQAKNRNLENDKKLISTFFAGNIQDRLSKYGIALDVTNLRIGANLYFQSSTKFYDFFKEAVEEKILSVLNELGLKGTLNEEALRTVLASYNGIGYLSSAGLFEDGLLIDKDKLNK